MFLVTIYCVHKVFSWTTTAVIFCLQAWIYSLVEKVCRAVLSVLDHLIVQLLPDWLPTLLVSDIASMLCLTALRSYWYSTRYLTSLKWLLIFRVGVWLIFSAPQACYRLWKAGQLRFEKRHTQWGPTTSTTRFGGFLQRSSAPALGVDLSTSSALPALPAPSLRPLPSSKTSALPAPPSSSSVRSLAPSQKRIGGVGAEPDGGLSPEELFYKQLKPRGRSKSRSLSNGNVGLHSRARATPVE